MLLCPLAGWRAADGAAGEAGLRSAVVGSVVGLVEVVLAYDLILRAD